MNMEWNKQETRVWVDGLFACIFLMLLPFSLKMIQKLFDEILLFKLIPLKIDPGKNVCENVEEKEEKMNSFVLFYIIKDCEHSFHHQINEQHSCSRGSGYPIHPVVSNKKNFQFIFIQLKIFNIIITKCGWFATLPPQLPFSF